MRRIGDALQLINGRAFKPSDWKPTGIPIVRIQNLNKPNAPFNYYDRELPEKFLLGDGDLLFAWSGTPGTSFGAHIWRGGKAWLNQHIFKVLFDEKEFDKKFLQLAINQNLNEYIRQAHGGAGLAHITKGKFEACELVRPPLPEQRRIVGEIEKQFTRLEAGVAALRRVQANLHRYRAAVLKAACEGPWQRLPVSKIGEAVTGSTPSTKDAGNLGSSLPFFKPTDLNAGYYVHEARQHLSEKGAKLARLLPERTVLVTCIGATIGKTGLARVACATNQQINALIVNRQVALPEWAYWCFVSPNGQKQIIENASATTLPILNKSRFENLELPVPPLAEQERIVAEVERRLSVVEELSALVTANLQRATRLRQSILQQAFAGKLVKPTA
jgi:type I restriction enzyme, S subunit